jgi:hypothetical protein
MQLVHLAYPEDPPADTSDIVYNHGSHPEIGDRSIARGDNRIPVERHGVQCPQNRRS